MIKEYWKDIPGYEGLYQASNLGKIKSLNYKKTGKEHILSPHRSRNIYLTVLLSKNGIVKRILIHRLVAITWIPNPNNYPVVNHKDGCRTNNFIYINPDGTVDFEKSNLEWCTQSFNLHYKDCLEKLSKAHINHPTLSKPVRQYTLDGKLVGEYPSAAEAERKIGISAKCIRKCRAGKRKTHAGFIWK